MRKYLTTNPIDMSALQQATIIFEYAKKRKRVPLLESVLEETQNDSERLLLDSAIKDIQCGNEWISDETQKIYLEKFPHDDFPLYPFLEVCGLPALFKKGDIIRKGNEFYYVGFLPVLIAGHCDFSDECYLCYPLSYPVKNEEDLLYAHAHIHVCEAERASLKKLTPQQMNVYRRIRTLLMRKYSRLMRKLH